MTFKEFQATGRAVADLRDHETIRAQLDDCDTPMPIPGRIYGDGLYIEQSLTSMGMPYYTLTIGNKSRSSTRLESLERDLYKFAISEGYI